MSWARAALALAAVVAAGALLVSGGSGGDSRTPAPLPRTAPPFLGTAVVGGGGLAAAVDAYGNVVDLRVPGPAGEGLIDNPSDRQAAGTVPADTGIVPRVRIGNGPARAFWRADSVEQRYLPRTNVVRTVARFGRVRVVESAAARAGELALVIAVRSAPGAARPSLGIEVDRAAHCLQEREGPVLALICSPGDRPAGDLIRRARRAIAAAAVDDRGWLAEATSLGADAPAWAQLMYRRSLLVLRALTDRRTGAVAAGARDGWTYVWPRDAGAAALAYAAAGYRAEARRVARFLLELELSDAARFDGDGAPVLGRGPQGDATGWVRAAAEAAGLQPPSSPSRWRDSPDYQEGDAGDFLGNALAAREPARRVGEMFGTVAGLGRISSDPGSGLDSAAAWAVEPFPQPALYFEARRTMLRLARGGSRFGITPGEAWTGGSEPWTAPTAWTAWSLASLARKERGVEAQPNRRAALRLLADLRRASTPTGALPERVDARTGTPRSTTPLAWSHAFAILALRELWPIRA